MREGRPEVEAGDLMGYAEIPATQPKLICIFKRRIIRIYFLIRSS